MTHLCHLSVLISFYSFLLFPPPVAQPVLFKTHLQNLEIQAGETCSLRCETTKPGADVFWRCGSCVLQSSSKYHLKQEGVVVELVIYKPQAADSGEYSCDTGSQRTSAVLTVQGTVWFFITVLFTLSLDSQLSECPSSLLSLHCWLCSHKAAPWVWSALSFHVGCFWLKNDFSSHVCSFFSLHHFQRHL